MGTALIYLLVVVAVAAAVFGIASAVFGRGEELAPLPPGATPTRLPVGDVGGDDVRALRFQQAVRGYRMAEVDWVLDRLATELDRIGAERDDLRARLAEVDAPPGADGVVVTELARSHRHGGPVLRPGAPGPARRPSTSPTTTTSGAGRCTATRPCSSG